MAKSSVVLCLRNILIEWSVPKPGVLESSVMCPTIRLHIDVQNFVKNKFNIPNQFIEGQQRGHSIFT